MSRRFVSVLLVLILALLTGCGSSDKTKSADSAKYGKSTYSISNFEYTKSFERFHDGALTAQVTVANGEDFGITPSTLLWTLTGPDGEQHSALDASVEVPDDKAFPDSAIEPGKTASGEIAFELANARAGKYKATYGTSAIDLGESLFANSSKQKSVVVAEFDLSQADIDKAVEARTNATTTTEMVPSVMPGNVGVPVQLNGLEVTVTSLNFEPKTAGEEYSNDNWVVTATFTNLQTTKKDIPSNYFRLIGPDGKPLDYGYFTKTDGSEFPTHGISLALNAGQSQTAQLRFSGTSHNSGTYSLTEIYRNESDLSDGDSSVSWALQAS